MTVCHFHCKGVRLILLHTVNIKKKNVYERLGRLLEFNLSIDHHYPLRPAFYVTPFQSMLLCLIELNPGPFARLFLFIPIPHTLEEKMILRFQVSLSL